MALTRLFTRIKKHHEKKDGKQHMAKKVRTSLAGAGIILVILIFFAAYLFLRNINVSVNFVVDTVAAVFGKEWTRDVDQHTNILLFGMGGGDHDGPDLTDSLMVMSYDHKKGTMAMLSFPRDLYVEYPDGKQSDRINSIYDYGKRKGGEKEGVAMLEETLEKVTGLDIHYYVRVDFSGFEQIVDELGGIELEIPEDFEDTRYPADRGNGYTVFRLKQGLQTLDGKTSLKYARSRHSTSDFDRSKRQHMILSAIKEKAMKQGYLTNMSKLKRLYYKVSSNMDTSFELNELIAGAKIMKDLDTKKMVSAVLTDDPNAQGGFLYTPARELFGGAFVLLPTGATPRDISYYKDIKLYVDLLVNSTEMYAEKPKVEILNGTKLNGHASKLKERLTRFGFAVENVGNSKNRDVEKTKVYYYGGSTSPALITALQNLELFVSAERVPGTEEYKQKGYDITIVLGSDYEAPLY